MAFVDPIDPSLQNPTFLPGGKAVDFAQEERHWPPYVARLGVLRAMHKVSARLSELGIDKRSENKAQGFNFRGIDDVLNVLSSVLVDAGLLIIPYVVSRTQTERTTKSGSTQYHVSLLVDYHLTAVEDGSTQVVRMASEAADTADKATSKAMSMAFKYMAFEAFCIPVEGLDDADHHTPEATVSKAAPAPAILDDIAAAQNLTELLALKQRVAQYAKAPEWKEIKAAYAAQHEAFSSNKKAA
ncbi:MAG TPA: ERF family protein [Candidatus Dormibacteraeota bacterium]|nr:ERF family protein [Candidatus Dormibacteraeota bacterium]